MAHKIGYNINSAVVHYIGYGSENWPRESVARLVEHFGTAEAAIYAPMVQNILKTLNDIPIDWSKNSLIEGTQSACKQMKNLYPELNQEALTALEWAYSWWWK